MPTETTLQELNEAKVILEAVNAYCLILAEKNNKDISLLKVEELRGNVSNISDNLKGLESDVQKVRDEIVVLQEKGALVLPEVNASQEEFRVLLDREDVETEINKLVVKQLELFWKLNEKQKILFNEYKTLFQNQMVKLKNYNSTLEVAQAEGAVLAFYQWRDAANDLLRSKSDDVSGLLVLHEEYCGFFADGKGDPNKDTSELFKQIESIIVLEFQALLSSQASAEKKLEMIEKILPNLDQDQRGSSSLKSALLPVLKELQGQIPVELFEKRSKFVQEDFKKILVPEAFQQPKMKTYTVMMDNQKTVKRDRPDSSPAASTNDGSQSPEHKKRLL